MKAMHELKAETADFIRDACDGKPTIGDILHCFIEVIEANGGKIVFEETPTSEPRIVKVGLAKEIANG